MDIDYYNQVCSRCGGEMEKPKMRMNPVCQKCQRIRVIEYSRNHLKRVYREQKSDNNENN